MKAGVGCSVELSGAGGASGSGAVSALPDLAGFFLFGVVGTRYGAKISHLVEEVVVSLMGEALMVESLSRHGPQPLVGPTPRSTTIGGLRR